MKRRPRQYMNPDDQLKMLEDRCLEIGDRDVARKILARDGYYSVVKGYKNAFIDRGASNNANDDRYKSGASLAQIHLLFQCDRWLRDEVRDKLMEAEDILKVSVVNAFCSTYREPEAYLNPASYRQLKDCREADKKNYTRNLIRILSTLDNARQNHQHKDFVSEMSARTARGSTAPVPASTRTNASKTWSSCWGSCSMIPPCPRCVLGSLKFCPRVGWKSRAPTSLRSSPGESVLAKSSFAST